MWVESRAIKRSSLHEPLPLPLRLNVTPFILGYLICLFLWINNPEFEDYPLFVLPAIFLLHVLSFLVCVWSVDFKTFLTRRKVKKIREGAEIKIIPTTGKGPSIITSIKLRKETNEYYIDWRNRIFIWSPEKNKFAKIPFPTNNPLDFYLKSRGINSDEEIEKYKSIYGTNKFDIPMPEFIELYKEQAVAPFFIFQLFCVLLWCLDEYWYYSVLTLFMLLIFEGTIVSSRLKNLKSLRNMIQPSHDLFVFRKNQWSKISSHELIPGDICSIVRQPTDTLLPCDLLLLKGTCVVNEAMLTGESTPQLKESIELKLSQLSYNNLNQPILSNLHLKKDRLNILFGGTNVINHHFESISSSSPHIPQQVIPKSPDNGAIGYVLRTGFETNQGKLIRTILFSTDRVTANNAESLLFILFLLIFALAASGYVLYTSWYEEGVNKYKLLLKCTLIITSVVPPELPMELSLAVTTSLVALAKLGIYCTEPFRIPFAGKLNVCCFDKTGTLTDDKLILKGIAGVPSNENKIEDLNKLIEPKSMSDWAQYAIAGCNSLMYIDNLLVGDPMEVESLQAIQWTLTKENLIKKESKSGNQKLKIIQRYHFDSVLKRMTTISVTESNNPMTFISMKGAPEVVSEFLEAIPDQYNETFQFYSRLGYRVISLAYKQLGKNVKNISRASREEVERNLTFCGFLIFECPIKKDSQRTIEVLNKSSHKSVIITGDNVLTACHVAEQLNIFPTNKKILVFDPPLLHHSDDLPLESTNESYFCYFIDNHEERYAVKDISLKDLKSKFQLAISGNGLTILNQQKLFKKYLPFINVYARVSPEQKELIILTLKNTGNTVLMCGDGTNDVGALKQAQIGIALLNTVTPSVNLNPNNSQGNPIASIIPPAPVSTQTQPKIKANKKGTKINKNELQGANTMDLINPQGQTRTGRNRPPPKKRPPFGPPSIVDDEELARIKLGDASIASPFTMKGSSVYPVVHIIRQGRCTLVTTLQMFMILALNCLITAYSMSVLYHDGYRMGDSQATIVGILIAMCFLFISRSKPLEELSQLKPASTIFTLKFFTSLLGQFAIHLASLIYVHQMATANSIGGVERVDDDAPFSPSLINTAVFLISSSMHVNTFAVNYRGHPFMQSLIENKPLLLCLSTVFGITLLAAAQLSPEVTAMLELVPLTPDFQNQLLLVMVADFVGAFLWDRLMSVFFGRL